MKQLLDRLMEMSFERRLVLHKIRGLSRPILLHLIKILKWEDDANRRKHLTDVDVWLLDVQDMTVKPGKRKRLKAKEYYSLLYDERIGGDISILKSMVERALKQYSNLPVRMSNDDVMGYLESIFRKVSVDIAVNNFDDIEDYLPKKRT